MVGSGDLVEFKLGFFVGIFMVFHGADKAQSGVDIGEEKWVGMVAEEAIMNYQFEFLTLLIKRQWRIWKMR